MPGTEHRAFVYGAVFALTSDGTAIVATNVVGVLIVSVTGFPESATRTVGAIGTALSA